MKTIPLQDLDETMQSLIRNAAGEQTVVVDQGVVVAEIRVPEAKKVGRRFPPNHWDTLSSPRIPLTHWDSIPVVQTKVDSTDIISEDRDR